MKKIVKITVSYHSTEIRQKVENRDPDLPQLLEKLPGRRQDLQQISRKKTIKLRYFLDHTFHPLSQKIQIYNQIDLEKYPICTISLL